MALQPYTITTYKKPGEITRYESALERSQARYNEMMVELRAAIGVTTAPIAPEFKEVADIYRTGGEYGAGAKAAIEKAARYGTSQELANLARTGMSSGTIAGGVRARYSRQATEQIQNVEDVRYEKLSSALQALASAKEARGIRVSGVYQTTAGLISGWKEPTMGEFTSPESIAQLQAQTTEKEITAANKRAELAAKTELAVTSQRIAAETELEKQRQIFTAGQQAIYQPTAAQQIKQQSKELLYRYL